MKPPFNIGNPKTWPVAFLVSVDRSIKFVMPDRAKFSLDELKHKYLGDCVIGAMECELTKDYMMMVNGPLQTGQFPSKVNGDASYIWITDPRCKQMVIGDAVVCRKTVLP